MIHNFLLLLIIVHLKSFYLQELGCLVDTAQDGSAAMLQCDSASYYVILLDLCLYPYDSGFDVAKKIKDYSLLNRATPLIAVSSHREAQSY